MCKSSECPVQILDDQDFKFTVQQWNDLSTKSVAVKKAENQSSDLMNVLQLKENKNSLNKRLSSHSKIFQFTRSAFSSSRTGPSKGSRLLEEKECSRDVPSHLTLLQLLALNALDLTIPASNILLKNGFYNWVQLSGHEDSFAPAGPGTIWKKSSPDFVEIEAYKKLMKDPLVSVVPHFYNVIEYNGEYFIEMQDLLYNFKTPSIMDIKMGTRTFLESEAENNNPRADLFEKMIKVDPFAPTAEELEAKAITKLRYMQFRENLSSSAELGFRIEGYKIHGRECTKELKMLKSRNDIYKTLKQFLNGNEKMQLQLIAHLQSLRGKLEVSPFFHTHEVIGSSILVIHDGKRVGAWMIDFAKTVPLTEGIIINHRTQWCKGNHEDGYLIGLDNLITILKDCCQE